MGCFYVLVCILCYGTYVFNCYTTCLHTLHFSVISKLNKGYSANADLFYLNYQTQSALRNTLMLLSKVFFMKTANGHTLIRGVLIQSYSAGAKNFTNYVFCHPQFSGVIQNIENYCTIILIIIDTGK